CQPSGARTQGAKPLDALTGRELLHAGSPKRRVRRQEGAGRALTMDVGRVDVCLNADEPTLPDLPVVARLRSAKDALVVETDGAQRLRARESRRAGQHEFRQGVESGRSDGRVLPAIAEIDTSVETGPAGGR